MPRRAAAARPDDKDQGYVCTFSVAGAEGRRRASLPCRRCARLSPVPGRAGAADRRPPRPPRPSRVYLGRALGVDPQVEIDYRADGCETGDVFVLATDGVHEHVGARGDGRDDRRRTPATSTPPRAASSTPAYASGSPDNLTVQIVRIDAVPDGRGRRAACDEPPTCRRRRCSSRGAVRRLHAIIRELHASSRSHVYLALEPGTGERVVLKMPSIDLRDDPAYLRRFMLEDWIARRIDNAACAEAAPAAAAARTPVSRHGLHRRRDADAVDGRPPGPDARTGCATSSTQVAAGLQAFHRARNAASATCGRRTS